MNGLELAVDYKHNDPKRSAFNALAGETFGIDFEPWYAAGHWSGRYVCHSYFDGDIVASNVSANFMDLVVCGKPLRAVQIGTVMTRAGYRGRGLGSSLMKLVVERYSPECDLIYLFANDSAYDFYGSLGFDVHGESFFECPVPAIDLRCAVRKFDIGSDADASIFRRLATGRIPVSERLGVRNDQHLLAFYCMKYNRDDLYYCEELDSVLVCSREGEKLVLYDILALEHAVLPLAARAAAIPAFADGAKTLEFMFTPDLVMPGLEGEARERDYRLFAMPGGSGTAAGLRAAFAGPFLFPRISHA